MTVWIVVLLVAVVLSPLAWLRPSRRQQGRMAIRMAARSKGLGMQMSRQEWPHWLPEEPPSPCPQYHRARRRGASDSWCYWQMNAGEWVNQWREPCTDAALLPHLHSLPADVYKVEATTQMISLCWGEKGDVQGVEPVAAVLKALA